MRIACPSCAAEYEVPEAGLTPRKIVRCARCGGEWIPVHATQQPEPDTAPDDLVHPEPRTEVAEPLPTVTAMDRLVASPSRPSPRAGLIGAWMLTAVVWLGAVAATVTWRDAIMRFWPPSTLILAPFGHGQPPTAQIAGKKSE